MHKVLRFFQLPGEERRLLVSAVAALLAVRVLSLLLSQRRVQAITGRRCPSASPSASGGPAPRDFGLAVERAATVIPGAGCLPQALATQWLVHRHGGEAELRVGVARERDGLLAHAWLESGGEVIVGGAQAAAYAVLERPPAERGDGG